MNNINPNILKALITGTVIVSAVAISTVAYFITKFDWSSILRSDPNKKNLNLSNIKINQFGDYNSDDNSDANSTLSQDSLKANLFVVNTLILSECEQSSAPLAELPLSSPSPSPSASSLSLSLDDNINDLFNDFLNDSDSTSINSDAAVLNC